MMQPLAYLLPSWMRGRRASGALESSTADCRDRQWDTGRGQKASFEPKCEVPGSSVRTVGAWDLPNGAAVLEQLIDENDGGLPAL
jgi:hypothetical protein